MLLCCVQQKAGPPGAQQKAIKTKKHIYIYIYMCFVFSTLRICRIAALPPKHGGTPCAHVCESVLYNLYYSCLFL